MNNIKDTLYMRVEKLVPYTNIPTMLRIYSSELHEILEYIDKYSEYVTTLELIQDRGYAGYTLLPTNR